MKALVVYYSLDGNTEKMAGLINNVIGGAEVVRLHPTKDVNKKGIMKFLHGGRQAMKEMEIQLKPYEISTKDADIIFIGTPIWAGKAAPAINTFIHDQDLKGKKVAFFFCSGGGDTTKAMQALQGKLPNTEFLGSISLKSPLMKDVESQETQMITWIKSIIK